MLGLTLYGIGAHLFCPAAVKRSFRFCGSTFIIGAGLRTLESQIYLQPLLRRLWTSGITTPRCISTSRKVTQAIGIVVGPILAAQSLQWVYLGIAIFVFVLAGIFFLYDIPDVPNADMARHAQDFGDVEEKPLKKKLLLWSAVLCQFYYSRSQVLVTGYFVNNAIKVQPDTSNAMGSNFLDAVPGCFAIGRF
ncbi:hypothetical protein FPQ18DRAFT_413331 [Pyronema domesticum]|nr:hypothetical protein FPQ18DRAFT_413331 [Pyronema domesticum]